MSRRNRSSKRRSMSSSFAPRLPRKGNQFVAFTIFNLCVIARRCSLLVGRLFIPSTGIARSSTRRTIAETATGTGRGVIDWSGRSSATENTRTARLPSGRDPLRQAFRGYPQAHDGTMWMVDSLQFDAVVEDHLPRTAQKSAGADVAKLAQNHPTELE